MCQHATEPAAAPPAESEPFEITCNLCGRNADDHGDCEDCDGCNEDPCERCDRCEDCCDCATCDYGRRCHRVDPDTICEHCERCRDHCDCTFCDECGDYIGEDDYRCGECGGCEDCCDCNNRDDDEPAVEFFTSALRFHPCPKDRHERNPSKRHISCELEVDNAESDSGISNAVRSWKGSIVRDGSLSSMGFEICTAPAAGDVFCDQIERICGALNDSRADVNESCGYHVHVDARDFNFWDVRRLILVYAKIESALYDCVPQSRRTSQYCEPCAEKYLGALGNTPKLLKKGVVECLYPNLKYSTGRDRKSDYKNARGDKYQRARYNALNIHSWLYRGTVECRMAAGTCNADKVILWGILWAGILDYAKTATEATISKLPADPWDCLLTIAPTAEVREWLAARRAKFTK